MKTNLIDYEGEGGGGACQKLVSRSHFPILIAGKTLFWNRVDYPQRLHNRSQLSVFNSVTGPPVKPGVKLGVNRHNSFPPSPANVLQ